jgi:uncharacterized protein YndB with AHSA1/START domain
MNQITIEVIIRGEVEKVWEYWTSPAHMTVWNHASDDWECPRATNDLTVGGMLTATMAAKDGSFSFEFGGTYTEIIPLKKLAYVMGDGRVVTVTFEAVSPTETKVSEEFDPESENTPERQREGWQAILDNFKAHVEMT